MLAALQTLAFPTVSDPRESALEADRALARSVAAGDDRAFEALVTRHHGRLARLAGRFFRGGDVVEDVVQDALLKAWNAMASYRGDQPLEHWLVRITTNACYDQLRKQKTRKEDGVSQLMSDAASEAYFWDQLSATTRDAGFWDRENTRLSAEALLASLPPKERLVLTLLVLEDLPVADVARMTGWSETNVKVRAFRARGKLRKAVSKGGRS